METLRLVLLFVLRVLGLPELRPIVVVLVVIVLVVVVITAELVAALHGVEARDRARERAIVLSRREREVLALVAQGARNRQIAEALEISEFTVKRHMHNILSKLQLPSRSAAGLFYRSAFGHDDMALTAGVEA